MICCANQQKVLMAVFLSLLFMTLVEFTFYYVTNRNGPIKKYSQCDLDSCETDSLNDTDDTTDSTTTPQQLSHPNHRSVGTWIWVWSEKYTYVWGERAFISTNMRKDPVLLLIAIRDYRGRYRKPNYKWYCHVHTSSSVKSTCTGEVAVDIDNIDWISERVRWYTKSIYFVCPLTNSVVDITYMYLSSESCESSKVTPKIPVVTNKDEQHIKRAGLCLHKPLFKVHNPQDIVQYIEIHKLFGVELFIIYIQDVSQSVRNILESYVAEGTVDLIEWNLKADMSRVTRDYGQLATIHECLNRNRGRVKYLGFSDFDEVFMPRTNLSLPDILDKIDGSKIGSFRFLHVFMHESGNHNKLNSQPQPECSNVKLPVYFKRYQRSNYNDSQHYSGNTLGSKSKVFVKPNAIIGMSRHSMYLAGKFVTGYNEVDVPGENGLLFHYRNKIQKGLEKRKLVPDFTMNKYQSKLVNILNHRLCNS